MTHSQPERISLARYAWLSIGAALATIALKIYTYMITNSVGLLSDALESFVNLAGALMAFAMLSVAARPADEEHAYGHSKAEYFSSGAEGTLIVLAALGIIVTAVPRLISPRPVEQVGLGLTISTIAALINLGVALVLIRVGRRYGAISLEANANHLMTDVWTTAGVLAGVVLVALTGWLRLDPIIALVVAGNIIWSGIQLVRRSVLGLMDTALPEKEISIVLQILDSHSEDGIQYHALRTRQSGMRRFVSFHVLVPGDWSVHRGHLILEALEADIRAQLEGVTVFTHLEPLEDPSSWDDTTLDRIDQP
jgi:cation diffusion facilitator family transporter